MGGRAHRQAAGHGAVYARHAHYAEACHSAKNTYAYNYGGCKRRNSAYGLGYFYGYGCGY